MLLKRYKLGAVILVKCGSDGWNNITVSLKRFKDSEEIDYCSEVCKFWSDTHKTCRCRYEHLIDCDDFDTYNYTYVPC